MIKELKLGKWIGAQEFRSNLNEILKSRHTYLITSCGKPVKAIIPYDVWSELLVAMEVALGRAEYASGGWIPVKRLKSRLKAENS